MAQQHPKSPLSPDARTRWPERFILLGLFLLPLQSAFTIDVGAPLKLSEICFGLGLLTAPLTRGYLTRRWETLYCVAMVIIILTSAMLRLAVGTPFNQAPGYPRSLTGDTLFYMVYMTATLLFWRLILDADRARMRSALCWSVWICVVTVIIQWTLLDSGQLDLLSSLGYQTDTGSYSLTEGGGEGRFRTGPFVEGQHLGVYAACTFFVALRARRWLAAAATLFLVYYSVSTSAYLALTLGAIIAFLVAPSAVKIIRFAALLLLLGASTLLSSRAQDIVVFQLSKLGIIDSPAIQSNFVSLDIRGEKTRIAFAIARENPFFGVGPGRYGEHFPDFATSPPFTKNYFNGITRPISENGYAHIASELGFPALLLTVCLFTALLAYRIWVQDAFTTALMVSIIIMFSTSSAWTFMPIWVFLALASPASRCSPTPFIRQEDAEHHETAVPDQSRDTQDGEVQSRQIRVPWATV